MFDNLIITLDNAFDNITIKEPTWEIFVCYDEVKAKDWKKKCSQFLSVRN